MVKKVWEIIRAERLKRRLTLEQFAERTGLSKSFLSQIERGLAQPSVSSLKKIASQFGISVVQLFEENSTIRNSLGYPKSVERGTLSETSNAEDVRVVRSNLRKKLQLPASDISYELLTPDLNRRLEVLYVRAAPGENTGDEPMLSIPGEKFINILKGSLELTIGDEVFLLQEGDSLYHPAHVPHSWRCVGSEPVEIFLVMTPPSF